jgi:putative hemolysin
LSLLAAAVIGLTLPVTVLASTWTIAPSGNVTSAQSNLLNGVSCATSTFCIAVGTHTHYTKSSKAVSQTEVQRYNGSAWSIGPSVNTDSTHANSLHGVDCLSSRFCVAVGFYSNGTTAQTLIERWNGTAWAIDSSPNVNPPSGFLPNELKGVSCISVSFCLAVGGFTSTQSIDQTLTELYNGSSWSLVNSPNNVGGNDLTSVACVSTGNCWAVGFGGDDPAIIEHWNGSGWAIVPSPNHGPIGAENWLYGVSCAGAGFCVATGFYLTDVFQNLIEQWNGTKWVIVPSPDTCSQRPCSNQLASVSCSSTTFCVAAGGQSTATARDGTLVEQFNGKTWTIARTPNRGGLGDGLNSVTCVNGSPCFAVGSYQVKGPTWADNRRTLIEQN